MVEDVYGKKYIEFLSTNSFGHRHPVILKAIRDQIDRTVDSLGISVETIALAEAIRDVSPGQLRDGKIIFSRSGTEACEHAVSMVRSFTRRPILVSFLDSFHGLTGGTIGLTNLSRYRSGSLPVISENVSAPFPNCYRCIFGMDHDNCGLRCLTYLEELFDAVAHPEDVAACIIEPVQMDGGVNIAPDDYLPALGRLCNDRNILLIADEVYTGFGKTGKFFAIEHWGVQPDIMCLGKCMGGGLPLAAVIGRKDILDSWRLGRAAMRPNTTAVSAALAHIQLLQDDVLQNVVDISKHILRVLKEFSERFEAVGDVRGKGLLIGVDIVKDRQSKTPGAKIAQTIRKEAFKRGLIINTTGRHEQVLTITPSLTLTKDQADTGLDILREALAAAE